MSFTIFFSKSALFIYPRAPNTICYHLYIFMFPHDLSILQKSSYELTFKWIMRKGKNGPVHNTMYHLLEYLGNIDPWLKIKLLRTFPKIQESDVLH